MKTSLLRIATTAVVGAGLASAASAAEILVTADIATSTTWTAGNTYNLQDQIYVLPGATLTIEPGTVIASTTGIGGSLAITKGAQIVALGTASDPIIFTSKADVATWDVDASHPTGGNPQTGVWREAANEWGNLTIMGAGYISENATAGNVATPDAGNVAAMEGLVGDFPGDTKVLYGGGDDNDDSGSLRYVTFRYGGKVIGLNNELNGLSLGGVGQGTDIEYIEIMNNVDDGIEIWGGCVGIKHFSIWNIGDDSFDVDQGWRGKAQFGLIVQGWSLDASQGSGVGDNCFETDGAEDSDWQPVTSAVIYNCTVVGQPLDGDHATAWRDNARVQYRQCVFTDIGDDLVAFDNVDGDGANGYGFNGTTSWADTWTSDWNDYSTVNAPANPAAFYKAQVDGKLAEITDSVFFNVADTTEANARGVFAPGNNNVLATVSPITAITRDVPVVKGGSKVMQQVLSLDPRAANDAVTSVGTAPNDGFFTPVSYRGAFAPNSNWLCGWSASDAFGFLAFPASSTFRNGGTNPASYTVVNEAVIGGTFTASVNVGSTGNALGFLIGYATPLTFPFNGRTILVNVFDAGGELTGGPSAVGPIANINVGVPNDLSLCGFSFSTQAIHFGGGNPFVLSNAQDLVVGNN